MSSPVDARHAAAIERLRERDAELERAARDLISYVREVGGPLAFNEVQRALRAAYERGETDALRTRRRRRRARAERTLTDQEMVALNEVQRALRAAYERGEIDALERVGKVTRDD